jgi:uncharacterized protein (TIGR02099 family)
VLRLATGAAAILLAAFAALVLWLRYDALPHADRYRDTIVSSIEHASGMAVKARALHGGWDGLRPSLTLEGFELADRRGHQVFELDRAEVTLSWWALFGLRVRFHDVAFYRPNLELRRGKDGLIYLADKPLNRPDPDDDGAFTKWLLAQPRLAIHDATLVWRDEMSGAPEVRLTQVEFAMRKHLGHHHAAFSALPPPNLAGRIDVRADMTIVRDGPRWRAAGQLFAEGIDTDLGGLRAHLPVPESLRAGVGSLRVWATFAEDGVREVLADVNMRDATAQLAADSLPLTLAAVSGRATYRARPDGFSFATAGLRFRLPGGEEAHPGNFSIERTAAAGAPPRVNVRADGIDLKIAATLIDYFPVPRDIKGQVGRYAPRGRIADASFSWTGENAAQPKSYAVKGRFEDLAVNPVDAFPGVTGISGSVEGTDAGGTLKIASRAATFTLERVFRAPIPLDALEVDATWKHAGPSFEVAIADAHFANADAEGHLAGTWRTLPQSPDHSPGYVDIKGKLSRATATRVADYIPNRLTVTRDWLERSIQAGTSDRATFEVRGDLLRFPFGEGSDGRFLVEGEVHDGVLKYHPDWPSVDAVQGTFRFENRRMEVHAKRATIFASRASNVSAVIEGLGIPSPLLTFDGDIDTSGADTVRFLRESPLVNGPGAFTRAVAIEGPGRLKLHLEYPLAAGATVRVAGDYQFNGATATVARDLALSGISGHLAFTEKSVSAPEITGTLFGAPARLVMSTQPDGRILSTLDAHVDAAALATFMPASLAAHLDGATDWRAQIYSGRDGTQLTVASDLTGLAVTLPDPLAKEAAAARRLEVTVARLGAPGEATVIELAGGVHGRVTHATVDGTERWNAALGFGAGLDGIPERPGLWLYGKLDQFDADAWQALFPPPPRVMAAGDGAAVPAEGAADGAPASGIELRGLHLALGRVRYMGRDFADLAVKLERDGRQWAGTLDSPKVAGEVRWDPAGKGRLTARFARLAMGQSARPDAPEVVASHPDLPALDITAERFEFRDHWLGALDLKAEPDGDAWRIDHLDITNKQAKFSSSGRWRRTSDGSLTTLDLKLDAQSLNALLGQFGFGDYLTRGTGKLSGMLAWSGYPYDFALGHLAGRFRIEARDGQFAKIQAGAGKLLGLLSLQSLPRRVTLDFRDVFSEGFAFDRIQADVNMARGILLTDNLEISGPAAFVSLSGEVSLPDETQKLTLRVVPEVTESVALAAALVGTPVLGLSTLLVSKLLNNPFGKVVAYEYSVTGSWDNPQVTRISAPLAKAAAATP